ncbi:hypothetical protein BG07_5435 (plasmid) [Bacillus pseudomycoides]|nr:hypothetical protein DJ92_5536 [Bacillus pseudomycoides]AJI14726.1 hypothetical protein BG07_5435 [Bacillus pseudomycoides]
MAPQLLDVTNNWGAVFYDQISISFFAANITSFLEIDLQRNICNVVAL